MSAIEDFEPPFHDIVERELFLELIADGTPSNLAGYEVGWTPRQIRKNLADPMFKEMIDSATDRMIDSVEKAMVLLAKKGNLGAQQMVLYNLRPDKWKDLRRIEVKTEVHISTSELNAAKETAIALLRSHGAMALQPGGALDVIDADSEEVPLDNPDD